MFSRLTVFAILAAPFLAAATPVARTTTCAASQVEASCDTIVLVSKLTAKLISCKIVLTPFFYSQLALSQSSYWAGRMSLFQVSMPKLASGVNLLSASSSVMIPRPTQFAVTASTPSSSVSCLHLPLFVFTDWIQ